jgi:hypothetical protein
MATNIYANEAQCWVLYKRPKEIPAGTTEADWPALFVARRFERSQDNLLYPTQDLIGGKTIGDLRRQLPPLKVLPRTPEDDENIVETRFTPMLSVVGTKAKAGHLSSGMRIDECLRHARKWWDKTGRHLVGSTLQNMMAQNLVEATHSGIMRGLPWDHLVPEEQAKIMTKWHQENIVDPAKERQKTFTELLLLGEVKGNG